MMRSRGLAEAEVGGRDRHVTSLFNFLLIQEATSSYVQIDGKYTDCLAFKKGKFTLPHTSFSVSRTL